MILFLVMYCITAAPVFAAEENFRSVYTTSRQNKHLTGKAVKNIDSPCLMSCSQSCLKHSWCTSTNYKESFGKSSKGNCELNKHEISPIRDESKLKDERGTTFTMFLKGCLMTGCLNGGSCFFDNENETFRCSCKFPWTGEKCDLGSECSSYTLNNETDRSVLFPQVGAIYKCDKTLVTAWYRFNSTAGTKMPTTCVSKNKCNTHATGWLNGVHPTPQEGIVNRRVCFHWKSSCCSWDITIKVRNCALFYVYRLVNPPQCQLRYCVTN